MIALGNLSLTITILSTILALVFAIIAFSSSRRQLTAADREKLRAGEDHHLVLPQGGLGRLATIFTVVAFLAISLSIISLVVQTGHGPFSNMFEFAISFSWGILLMGLIFQAVYKTGALRNVGLIVALLLLIFAAIQHTILLFGSDFTGQQFWSLFTSSTIGYKGYLVPALQQGTLLSVHVACAVVAYGTATIGFGAAILYLVQNRRNSIWLPSKDLLDTMSYQSVIISFPFLTLTIVLGALWGDRAWGRYWGWDPKETASLVTWLVFAAYMHARVMRGWRGAKTAIFIIVGFAAVLMTFFGNFVFTGLHGYG